MTEVESVVHKVLGPRGLELDEPIIDYIINVLADEDFDFDFEGEGAFDAVGELLVDSGCVTDDFECRFWSVPAPFLTKTYQMVDDSSMDKVISWNENKTAFVVWKTAHFARDLLPISFKHNNFSSFIREGFAWVCPVGMVIFLRH